MFKNQQLSKSYLDVLLVGSAKICEIQVNLKRVTNPPCLSQFMDRLR